jgi:predicted ATPase with chaperone activity
LYDGAGGGNWGAGAVLLSSQFVTVVWSTSAAIRERVERARLIQRQRFRRRPGVHANAHMTTPDLRHHCAVTPGVEQLLRDAVNRFGLSARGYHPILKIARPLPTWPALTSWPARRTQASWRATSPTTRT